MLEVVIRVPALLDVDEVARVRLEVAQKVEGQRAPLAGVPVVEVHIGVVCDRGRPVQNISLSTSVDQWVLNRSKEVGWWSVGTVEAALERRLVRRLRHVHRRPLERVRDATPAAVDQLVGVVNPLDVLEVVLLFRPV